MSAPPYMQLYVGDYLADTIHLTTLEHGAYLLILMGLWRSGGAISSDDATLARFARLAPANWVKVKGRVLSLLTIENGMVSQRRLTAELQKYATVLDKKREAGKSSARAKSLKNNEAESTPVEHLLNEPEPEPDKERISETTSPHPAQAEPGASDDVKIKPERANPVRQADIDRIWSQAPRTARERSSKSDVGRALKAAVRRGAAIDEIAAAVARYHASPQATKDDCRAMRGLHRTIQEDRWRDWSATVHCLSNAGEPMTPEQFAEWRRQAHA